MLHAFSADELNSTASLASGNGVPEGHRGGRSKPVGRLSARFSARYLRSCQRTVSRYLQEVLGRQPLYICGERHSPDFQTHAWLVCDGFIIDITADQFRQPPVIVARQSVWHGEWEQEPGRHPSSRPNNGLIIPRAHGPKSWLE